jgi:hypothetical protein
MDRTFKSVDLEIIVANRSLMHSDITLSLYQVAHDELKTKKRYVIKLVSDLREVGGSLRVLRFPPPLKLIATI